MQDKSPPQPMGKNSTTLGFHSIFWYLVLHLTINESKLLLEKINSNYVSVKVHLNYVGVICLPSCVGRHDSKKLEQRTNQKKGFQIIDRKEETLRRKQAQRRIINVAMLLVKC